MAYGVISSSRRPGSVFVHAEQATVDTMNRSSNLLEPRERLRFIH
ncbi:hypothetical protein [Paenibacillus sp. MBLB4367]